MGSRSSDRAALLGATVASATMVAFQLAGRATRDALYLSTFPTRTLTRPIVLLLTNAYIHTYFQQHLDETGPSPTQPDDFGRPQKFIPQFDELYWVRTQMRQALTVMQSLRRACRVLGR